MCVVGSVVDVADVEVVEVVDGGSLLLELLVVDVCDGDDVSEATVLDGSAEVGAADGVVGGRRSMVLTSFSSTFSAPAMAAETIYRPSSKNVDRILADGSSDQFGFQQICTGAERPVGSKDWTANDRRQRLRRERR